MFVVVVNIDDLEEGSTDDEGEDGLDLSNMFDEVPQDTDNVIETIDALQQELFFPVTQSPVVSPAAVTTPKQSDIATEKPSEKPVKRQLKWHQRKRLALLQAGH